MRYPIQHQLLRPMLLVVLLGSTVTALLAAWLGQRTVRQADHERLQQLAGTLTDAGFPLTDAVLKRMSDLSAATFLTLDDRGALQHSSRPFSEDDRQILVQLPLVSQWDRSAREQPVELSVGDFQAVRIAVRSSPGLASSLVILTSQQRWNDLAWQAALPPLLAGMIAASGAALFAVVLSQHFVSRIRLASQRAARLADGIFESDPPPPVDDELRDLAIALNTTAGKLKDYEAQIRVGERMQTLGRLGAGMAHQLRNAITGARMALDLHTAELPTGVDRESLAIAVRQLTLMEAYLQRFLTLGRGETPSRRNVDLRVLISEAKQLVEPLCRHHAIDVRWEPPPTAVTILGDIEALRQMVLNLMMNAIEAVQPLSPAERRIGLDLTIDVDDVIHIRVSDHGPGPAMGLADSLFNRFVTDKPDGTGLGLAVAREIATTHDGTIHWRRDNGATVFIITLPTRSNQSLPSAKAGSGDDIAGL